MEYNKYLKNKIIFLILKLIFSLLIGSYSLILGIISICIFILDFICEYKNSKHFINKVSINEDSIPFPFIIMKKNKVIYISKSFKRISSNIDASLIGSITEIIPDFEFGIEKQSITFNETNYLLYTESIIYGAKQNLNIIYFNEISYAMDNQNTEYMPITVSFIFIDNLEYVLSEIHEDNKPLFLALIDKKLNKMAEEVGGIIRKFEKDRYLFIFYEDKLNYLKESNFKILEDIKKINLGNKMSITLSLGMGIGVRSLKKSMEYAKESIDLALGRGGDQIVIKDSSNYYYYGGTSKEVETKDRVKSRVKACALEELISKSQNVIIMGHKKPDLDCFGAAIGIHAIVRLYGIESNIILNKSNTSIDALYNNISKEEEYHNTFICGKKALNKINNNTLVILTDTKRPSLVEDKRILEKATQIVVIDHHRKTTEEFENLVLVYREPSASSTCELITDMIPYLKNKLNLLSIEADALLAGITVDTKNFVFKTGVKTFEAAAFLKTNGADSTRVKLLFQYNIDTYKDKTSIVSNFEVYNSNIALSVSPSEIVNPSIVVAQAADDLLNINGIEASFVLYEENNIINISARSLGTINVQVIMEKLNGGGHYTASGAQIPNMGMNETIILLKKTIDNYKLEGIK